MPPQVLRAVTMKAAMMGTLGGAKPQQEITANPLKKKNQTQTKVLLPSKLNQVTRRQWLSFCLIKAATDV